MDHMDTGGASGAAGGPGDRAADRAAREAQRIARDAFGAADAAAAPLPGDTERNFHLRGGPWPRGEALLRVFVSEGGAARGRYQRDLAAHAAERDPWLAERVQGFVAGTDVVPVEFQGRPAHAAVLDFLPGRTLASLPRWRPAALHRGVGALLGRLDAALADFAGEPPPPAGSGDDPSWTLLDGPDVIAPRLASIPAGALRRDLVARILERAAEGAVPRARRLRASTVHQDGNDHNILVATDASLTPRAAGLIDFGDATRTATVAEPAIAAAYMALEKRDPLTAMADVVAGYHGAHPLDEDELAVLFELALLRLATSVAVSSARAAAGGASGYHLVSQRPAWEALETLADVDAAYATARLRAACGLEPVPGGAALAAALRRADPAPALGATLADCPTVDLSIDSPFLLDVGAASDGGLDPTMEAWGAEVERMRGDRAAVLGRHGETRLLYGTDAFSEAREDRDEPRAVHIGVDLFAPAGTDVFAALDGVVESVAVNDAPLDYGPTVILRHDVEGHALRVLYGHLASDVVGALEPGARVTRGERIGALGRADENGGWPPHLHLQIVRDPFGRTGDFPGVCAASERDVWTSVSPDPAPLLGLESCGADEPRDGDLLARRASMLCGSLSIAHGAPLHMVRGRGTTLFDAGARPYLDGVNNVPHVGHCHPRVVRAARRQIGLLNTNTRYLSEGVLRYAEGLRALLPEHLEVVYLVSSGSEANEVALRLARAASGGERADVIVQEHGYHGHTNEAVRCSHYKFARRGGFPRPDHVHVAPCPDAYRGRHRGADAGARYADEVDRIAGELAERGRPPMAMLAEAIIGCGGQVVPPEGYLRAAFDAVRRAGGVAIADEVQVGLWRVGTHAWAFEEQGAVPDVVTMGKPLGNAHPIAAVATTRAIADAFDGGMEFFATFGGNNVSAAIGAEVLDVLRDERLMENAVARGEQFRAAMDAAREALPGLVGEVRGRGLYVGVDLVQGEGSREPDGAAAAFVASRCRERGVLVSTDGPAENVIKIKPPLSITDADMRRLTDALTASLREVDALRGDRSERDAPRRA